MRRDTYSRAEETPTADGDLDDLPQFGLGYALDDPYWPEEVTVFDDSSGASIMGSWITMDLDHAVPIEEVA